MPLAVSSVAALLLGATFAVAGVTKAFRPGRWREVLSGYRLPGGSLLYLMVPASEAAAAGLLLSGATRIGGVVCLVLLAAFSAALLRARSLQGDRLPCGCFGRSESRDYRTMLARNGGLAALAIVTLAPGRDLSFLEGVAAPDRSEALPAVLVAVGLAVVAGTLWSVSRALRSGGR